MKNLQKSFLAFFQICFFKQFVNDKNVTMPKYSIVFLFFKTNFLNSSALVRGTLLVSLLQLFIDFTTTQGLSLSTFVL